MSLCIRRKLLLPRQIRLRLQSTKAQISSALVRQQFKDYFVNDHHHIFVPSSPLRPLCDATVPFVNAGMNQFKTILQGQTEPPWTRAANFQKCARVGGKHNDLNIVGSDGYHHTFFEMLGNWSFGDYSKKEACKMAWDLLIGPYRLNPDQLYVTYFGGNHDLNISADLECREIWLELGVKENHILPFGLKENFWEMGLSGPCGPCTEIHVDHVQGRSCAQDRVNAGFSDVTELWNIVFIQYQRNLDGTLTPLKTHHVDTGMGFERLVALLNGYTSNYDTDIFRPLLQAIHKNTNLPMYCGSFDEKEESYKRDYVYRVLCDHSRLLTVALADGIYPSHQYKLRWVLRKTLRILSNHLNSDIKFLIELTNHVAESLHSVYPEICETLPRIQAVISNESDIFNALLSTLPHKWRRLVTEEPRLESLLLMGSNPSSIVTAYEKVKAVTEPELPSSLSILLYESLGLNIEMIGGLCEIAGLKFNVDSHEKHLEKYKVQSKLSSVKELSVSDVGKNLLKLNIPFTYDDLKYDYTKDSETYTFPIVNAKVLALIVNGTVKEKVNGGTECGIVLDRTNFYHTAGGQVNDTGFITDLSSKQNSILVKKVQQDGGYVIHFGTPRSSLEVGDAVELKINRNNRLSCMRNHTLAHLLNGKVNKLMEAPIQVGCLVESDFLKLSYNLHGGDINVEDIKAIEEDVRKTISECVPVKRYTVDRWGIPPDTLLVPSALYPNEKIHIVDIVKENLILSREPCCGTHLHNTGDCKTFCITEVMKHSKGKCAICAVSGPLAEESIANGQKILSRVNSLQQNVETFLNSKEFKAVMNKNQTGLEANQTIEPSNIQDVVKKLLKLFRRHEEISISEREISRRLPYTAFVEAEARLGKIFYELDKVARTISEREVQEAAKNVYFLVHHVQSVRYLDSVLLNKITRKVNIPTMLFSSRKDGEVKIRCCVPAEVVSSDFNAELWLNEIKEYFNAPKPEKPQYRNGPANYQERKPNPAIVSTLSSVRTNPKKTENIIKEAMKAANGFARNMLPISS